MPRRGPLHSAEGGLIRRLVFDIEITQRRDIHRCLDPLYLILGIDGGVDPVLAEHRNRDDIHLLGADHVAVAAFLDLLPPPQRHRVRPGQASGLEEPMGVHPHFQLVELRQRRRHCHWRPIAIDVPGKLAIDDMCLAGSLLGRRSTGPTHPILP